MSGLSELFEEAMFDHECEHPGCTTIVQFDDEPWCWIHIPPDQTGSVPGYSARAKAKGGT